jgi:hypothetical protein
MRTEPAFLLAKQARRTALILAMRGRPELTIEQIDELLTGDYGNELAQVTVGEILRASKRPALKVRRGESLEDAVMRVFRRAPTQEFASSFFCRNMGLERWTAQALLRGLVEGGLLVRTGKTSTTRYSLRRAPDLSDLRGHVPDLRSRSRIRRTIPGEQNTEPVDASYEL